MKNKNLHTAFLDEIDKMMLIADLQIEAKIIENKEYRKIMFLLMDKAGDYMQNLEKIEIPELDIKKFESIDLLNLTNVLFSTG